MSILLLLPKKKIRYPKVLVRPMDDIPNFLIKNIILGGTYGKIAFILALWTKDTFMLPLDM
jgi:hypothetical protein